MHDRMLDVFSKTDTVYGTSQELLQRYADATLELINIYCLERSSNYDPSKTTYGSISEAVASLGTQWPYSLLNDESYLRLLKANTLHTIDIACVTAQEFARKFSCEIAKVYFVNKALTTSNELSNYERFRFVSYAVICSNASAFRDFRSMYRMSARELATIVSTIVGQIFPNDIIQYAEKITCDGLKQLVNLAKVNIPETEIFGCTEVFASTKKAMLNLDALDEVCCRVLSSGKSFCECMSYEHPLYKIFMALDEGDSLSSLKMLSSGMDLVYRYNHRFPLLLQMKSMGLSSCMLIIRRITEEEASKYKIVEV